MLGCGEHEDGRTAFMLWEHCEGFDTAKEALLDIGRILIEYLEEESKQKEDWHTRKKCEFCDQVDSNYCPNCGLKLVFDDELPTIQDLEEEGDEQVGALWQEIFATTNNDFPSSLYEMLEENGWYMWASPGGSGWIFVDAFDWLLLEGINEENYFDSRVREVDEEDEN